VCVCSLSRAACKAHVLYYIAICGLSRCTIFYHTVPQTARFSEREIVNEHKNVCFVFSTVLSETFLIVRRNERDIAIHVQYIDSSVKYCYCGQILMKLEICRHILEIYSNIKLHEKTFRGSWVVTLGRTDGQTDRQTDMTKLIAVFRSFAKARKKETNFCVSMATPVTRTRYSVTLNVLYIASRLLFW